MTLKKISGGVTAPKGFKAAGVHCGIRKNSEKMDLALILADEPCAAAVTYTKNLVKAAPVHLTKINMAKNNGYARAVFANSGNANACALNDTENAIAMCAALAEAAGIKTEEIIVNSTGVIGQELPIEKIKAAAPKIVASLNADGGSEAAAAIMTTDLTKKEIAISFELCGKTVRIGAMAKGSGMIAPNMATMLAFVTTDCSISPKMLSCALSDSVKRSYNRISVDGDVSTNDMAAVLASGAAKNEMIVSECENYKKFCFALDHVNKYLAIEIARDGEGAKKLITCRVTGAANDTAAEILSMSVINSSLVKTMMAGADANFGRVLCAMGYSGASFDTSKADIKFSSQAGEILVCKNGKGLAFDETLAKDVLTSGEITIGCSLGDGEGEAEAFGCDLTAEYVKINGDYRS
ncbi:MAG: bifunctional glutamate N-acetyltransferase/amino-acid acetyltransferase ArgJ [Defluviitaleaceae bacterium]|nr:bifunctional glutamate N-acetyltransferase/amino-acid acetyltransferase ArgJ [Defluviitaleaceae bacterium]